MNRRKTFFGLLMDKQTEKPLTVSVLLNAFLDLPTKWALTADIVLSADNVALFQLLPLIMAHIQRASRLHDDREPLVRLLHVLRVRFASCRWLKLRFLILAHHPAFSGFWTYVPVHHSHAYTVARHVVKQLVADVQSLGNNNTESCALTHREKERNNVDALLTSASALLYFAETSLFHPTKGIRLRPILHHRVVMRSGFNGKQLVDAIIARVVDGNRSYAIAVAQKLLDIGIIYPVAARLPNFEDNCRAVYQCRRTVLRDDSDRRFCIFSADGIDLKSRDSSPDGSGRSSFHGIRRVEFRIPMDMVDFQSLDFWTKAVYTKKAEEGYHYDFRAVAHPFYSVGLAQGLHELKIINSDNGASDDDFEVSANSGEESNDDSGSSDCTSISTPTTSYPIVRDHGIVDWMQQSAIISSIVVLKVFSSLAHPKIIELRKPLEGGVLTSEDQFVSLLPHLFVKTGDNLMQDLGVQLMFRIFNHVWNASSHSTQPYRKPPYCVTYEVMPTSASDGLMQAVTGLTSLKDFDWKLWAEKFGADEDRITDMLRSAVGSYIGTYTLGYVYSYAHKQFQRSLDITSIALTCMTYSISLTHVSNHVFVYACSLHECFYLRVPQRS